jgi:hypothetical protein
MGLTSAEQRRALGDAAAWLRALSTGEDPVAAWRRHLADGERADSLDLLREAVAMAERQLLEDDARRIPDLAALVSLLQDTMGPAAATWWTTPQLAVDGLVPRQLALSDAKGLRTVRDAVVRIRSGTYT